MSSSPSNHIIPRAALALAVASALALSLPGCSGDSTASSSDDSAPVEEVEPAPVDDESNAATTATDGATEQVDSEGEPADAATDAQTWVASHEGDETYALADMFALGEVSSIRLIGDSITVGYGTDGSDLTDTVIFTNSQGTFYEPNSEGDNWANLFRQYALAQGVEDFTNAGVSGARMSWLAKEPDPWLGDGATVIFVMLGTNDAVYSTEEVFRDDCETALAAAAEKCDLLVVMSPPDNEREDGYVNKYGMDVVDSIVSDVCAQHGWLHVSLLDSVELGGDEIMDDQCHPTSAGSHKMWEAIVRELHLDEYPGETSD